MKDIKTVEELFKEVAQLDLYVMLIDQLNKDFALANVDLQFAPDVLPSSLKLLLHEKIYKLIQEQFIQYLNLLYIIDVSEEKIRGLDGNDVLELSENVTFLILRREWQKVYYRSQFSS